jgi:hypothetical protein
MPRNLFRRLWCALTHHTYTDNNVMVRTWKGERRRHLYNEYQFTCSHCKARSSWTRWSRLPAPLKSMIRFQRDT